MKKTLRVTKVTATVVIAAGILIYSLLAGAGNLEPDSPPGDTMVTLDEISAQIAALPKVAVKQIIRGVINIQDWNVSTLAYADLNQFGMDPIEPSRCVVLLSDSIVTGNATPNTQRTGAYVVSLTNNRLTVQVENQGSSSSQRVSYQIIEYE